MIKEKQPTVDELNEIQREWMALDPHAPKSELDRVFALMKRYPKRYVSGHDGYGMPVIDGMPWGARPLPLAEAIEKIRAYGGRTDVAWNGTLGIWYSLGGAL